MENMGFDSQFYFFNSVCWNLTNRCNEYCKYCFRELMQEPRKLEDNYKIIDNLKKLGIENITFAGGEPLMYPYLTELIDYAYKNGFYIKLITNGSLINSSNLNILEHVKKITFSLDSTNSNINENLGRGIDHYGHLKKIIPLIHKKYPTVDLEMNSVVTKRYPNEPYYLIDEINNSLYLAGIKKLKILRFDPIRGNALLMKDDFYMTDESFGMLKDNVKKDNLFFKVEFRDIEDIERNYIISPNGSLTIAVDSKDQVIVNDMSKDIKDIQKDLISIIGEEIDEDELEELFEEENKDVKGLVRKHV